MGRFSKGSEGEWGESDSCPTHKAFSNLYSPIPWLAKVTFFTVVLILISSTLSFLLRELESLLDNYGIVVEGYSVIVRDLGITLANSLIGKKNSGAPSSLLQKAKGIRSPRLVTFLPL